jgi:hypothetical protein
VIRLRWCSRHVSRATLARTAATLIAAAAVTACRSPTPDRQLADLYAMVDTLLPTLERIAALEAREPIRIAVRGRREIRRYIEGRLDQELPPRELAALHAAYAAFGLLPDTLDLRGLLLEVYSEQVVGYYDPDEGTLIVLAGVGPAGLETVLAHELVHALQDQHVNLDSLMTRGDDHDHRDNDRQLAAQAALEGHATLAMFLLLAERQTGQPVAAGALPPIAAQLRPGQDAADAGFPQLRDAPAIIRETLLFPYFDGAGFVQELWAEAERRGEPRPAPIGAFMPVATSQVLHPRARFLARRADPASPRFGPEPAGWRIVYENNLGELELRILLREQLGAQWEEAAAGWAGERYRLVEDGRGRRALRWVTIWETDEAAARFADAWRAVAARRPERSALVVRLTFGERPGVLVIDSGPGLRPEEVPGVELGELVAVPGV